VRGTRLADGLGRSGPSRGRPGPARRRFSAGRGALPNVFPSTIFFFFFPEGNYYMH